MNVNRYRQLQLLLIIILTLFQLRFGIIPGWTEPRSDFPNYYTASKLLITGQDLSNSYNDEWFREQISLQGFKKDGKFSPFPPATALMMTPLAWMSPMNAKQATIVINVFLLLACIKLMTRITRFTFLGSAVFLLLGGIGLANNFYLGQFYLCLLFFITYAVVYAGRYPALSGALLGTGIAVKYFPVVILPALLKNVSWKKLLAGTVICIAILNLLALYFFGADIYASFFQKVFVPHLDGRLSGQSPFSETFQSWNSFFRNLFLFHPLENPAPFVNSPLLFNAGRFLVNAFILVFSSAVIVKLWKRNAADKMLIVVFMMVPLALVPASASYHYILLSLPVVLVCDHFKAYRQWVPSLITLGFYAGIGFLSPLLNKIYESLEVPLLLRYHRLLFANALCIFILFHALRYSRQNDQE